MNANVNVNDLVCVLLIGQRATGRPTLLAVFFHWAVALPRELTGENCRFSSAVKVKVLPRFSTHGETSERGRLTNRPRRA